MSRRVFTSAVLLLVVVMMCCSACGAAQAAGQSTVSKFEWKDVKDEGVTVESLGVPGLLNVGSDVFAVAEAQCKKGETSVFTGIASQILTMEKSNEPKELLEDAKKDTQVLEEVTSGKGKKVDVSRPTTVVDESDIYMLVGKHSHDAADNCQAGTENIKSGMLLVKVQVSGEADKKIDWKTTDGVPCTLGEKHESWTGLIGGGGSGVKMNDGTLAFPVEGTKKEEKYVKAALLIICSSKEVTCWKLSKGMSADGCGVPSVVEWGEDKLMMMTACDGGRRRVYEIGDKGESWTEALGTLSRVWGYPKGNERSEKGVRSGFITANIGDGVEDNRNVMLVTLPVYSNEKDNLKGVLHLWLTDNTHIVDIGSVSEKDEDVTASSLLYKSGNDNNEKLIALYEKKGDADTPSLGMVSVLLTAQLEKVKEVLKTWKEVDKRVSKLCPSIAAKDAPTDDACATDKITDGLVGFLSGNFSGTTWKDEYLGVNAAVKKGAEEGAAEEKAEKAESSDGVNFQGAWAEWPVGSQGENQLYHFANYNFTLVATVSIHKVPTKGDNPISLMGVMMDGDGDNGKTVLLGLSYNNEGNWAVLCGGTVTKDLSSTWDTQRQYQVAIVLQNGTQGSVYVDGQPVSGDAQCELETTNSKEISHFYIGGDGGSAGGQGDVSVTVTNVLLYNRPLSSEEIGALNPNKAPIPSLEKNPLNPSTVSSGSVVSPAPPVAANAQIAGNPSTPAGTQLTEQGQSMGSSGAGSGGASASAVSTVSTPSAEEESVVQVTSGTSPDGTQTVGGGFTADGEPTMETREGGTNGQEEEVNTQDREVNTTALSSSLGNVSQGNNSDAGTMRESGMVPSLLLLLLGLWGLAAL
ncbi:trans-sialidase [Trypanosoma cruzi Dm28c]|uniref:Trans-sialidase n=2 Tax=Trypanosoma cruzi TaxID=5693 RepID=V5ANR6_TRYCR|nr:trans-sialidase [Trypanosoma cruzi Dm28c]PBJ77913.1 trans-sialidase [Trypanosoma cruzi cruzi]PWU93101.1 putative trans-sialidase, Group V [Trypanosoma cruzi]